MVRCYTGADFCQHHCILYRSIRICQVCVSSCVIAALLLTSIDTQSLWSGGGGVQVHRTRDNQASLIYDPLAVYDVYL